MICINPLVEGIKNLIEKKAPFGTYHLCGSGFVSWYGFAKKIFEILKIRIKNADNVSLIFISYLLFFRDTALFVLFDFKALWPRLKRLWLKLFT